MRITMKDTTPGHRGTVTRDTEIEPIQIHISKEERDKLGLKILQMLDDANGFIAGPNGMTLAQAEAILASEIPNPPPLGLDPQRCAQVIEAIESGSLDSAKAMLRAGIPGA